MAKAVISMSKAASALAAAALTMLAAASGPAAGAEHAAVAAPQSSRFTKPVPPNEARLLKTEEDAALAVAESAAHDMEVLAHTVPEHRLARAEIAALHAIRPLVQRRQQLRQTFIRLGAKPTVLAATGLVEKRPATIGKGSTTAKGSAPGGSNPVGAAAGGDGQAALFAATRQMQETQMSFNLQYLQLQAALPKAPAEIRSISEIMKTKHDTVKNSIGNIR